MAEPLAATDPMGDQPGDDAFGRILIAMQPRLRAFLGNLNRVDAEDLVQETIARAWRSRATFDPDRGAPEAWLLRIAFRAFLDHRDARQPTHPLDPPPTAQAPGPAEHAAAKEQTTELLQRLSEVERDILLRFHSNGEPIASIARALGLPPGTIKSHLHRARARLWAIVNKERP